MIVEFEFRKIRGMILGLMSGNHIIQATSGESKVFYQEMKADHYRYVAGFSDGERSRGWQSRHTCPHTLKSTKVQQKQHG